MTRRTISTESPWEPIAGYARAVRVGRHVYVSGTTAFRGREFVGEGDAQAQARQIFANIQVALERAGASLGEVVRTRMYVVDIAAHGRQVAEAHRETFGAILPASTMVEVPALVDPRMLVEIEADAVMGG